MKIGKSTLAVCAILALMATAVPAAAATDAVKATVTPTGQPLPILQENGNGLTPGTYAIGTIQLFYTVQAFQFPTGPFATFDVGMVIAAASNPNTKKTTSYPVQLTLEQIGSDQVTLTPATSVFSVTDRQWTGGTSVTISIPAPIPDPEDGDELVANMRLTTPSQSQLDTVTNIQVHIKLVFPTACVKLYNFITDQAFTTIVTSTEVNVNVNVKKATTTVRSTNPYGNLSDNVLVVNTCSVPQTFDLKVALDPWFGTNPSGNPGNAVFTFTTAGVIDPAGSLTRDFGTGTARGQALNLTNVTVDAGDMFLMKVHMSINNGASWTGGTAGTFGGFSAGLYVPGTAFVTPLGDVLAANPATASLGYTVK